MIIPKKYTKKNLKALKNIAVQWCHRYIRKRDEGKPCVSCGKYTTLQAGHFYPAGKYGSLKFDERNINGQCYQCNIYGSNHTGAAYERELRKRIGDEEVETLHFLAKAEKRNGFKWDKFSVIEKIIKYQGKCRGIGSR